MTFKNTVKIANFEPGRGHGPDGRRRAQDAAKTLLRFALTEGRIPDHLLPQAAKAASVATGNRWTPRDCVILAHQMRLTISARRN